MTNDLSATRADGRRIRLAVRRALGPASMTLLALTTFIAGNATAQEEQQVAQATQSATGGSSQDAGLSAGTLDEVTVTGTRILRDGYEAPTPISVLGAEELTSMGVSNIAD